MAQQNHNIDYINVVDGITVWERLRVIRNFLMDREAALAMALLEPDFDSMSKREREEYEILQPQHKQNVKNAEDEVVFLKSFEAKLAAEAEKTRIPGKTDDEMYEINFVEESVQRDILKMRSQILSRGTLEPDMVTTVLRNPLLIDRAITLNLLPENIKQHVEENNLVQLLSKETQKCIDGY